MVSVIYVCHAVAWLTTVCAHLYMLPLLLWSVWSSLLSYGGHQVDATAIFNRTGNHHGINTVGYMDKNICGKKKEQYIKVAPLDVNVFKRKTS